MKNKNSFKHLLFLATLILSSSLCPAQTEVGAYRPGITEEGITYFLPTTRVRVVVTARKAHYIPGEFCAYAERYLRLNNVPQTPYDEWEITDIKLLSYGVADTSKGYTIKMKAKTSAPLVSLTQDGRLLSINAQPENRDTDLPVPSITKDTKEFSNGENYKTEEILAAGSTAKMAELTANEIYDIRENRGLLTKGQADFMPKDGEQLRLMLTKLDNQEEGLMRLFQGTSQSETHILTFDIAPVQDVEKEVLFNFSKYLGFTEADDPAGTPFYYSLQALHTLPAATTAPKEKKEVEDVRYTIPDRVKMTIFDDSQTYASSSILMAQFGRTEHLGGELFNKKNTTHIQFSPITGGIVRIDADKIE